MMSRQNTESGVLMENQAESLRGAAGADPLKLSDTGGRAEGSAEVKRDEDRFYDCEGPPQTETPDDQTSTNPTEASHGVDPDRDARLTTGDGGAEDREASRGEGSHQALTSNGVPADDEFEGVPGGEEEENGTDSDSEVKDGSAAPAEFDDECLREAEKDLTEEERESRRAESTSLKEKGNAQFKNQEYSEASRLYTDALRICPVCYSRERSILFSNRAAARMHVDQKPDAITDCSKAIELNPDYVRAILRRAELYEDTDKLDEALEDYKSVLEKEPGNPTAREACYRLPQQIQDRNEKLKDEMISKLKDLGNMVLRPFGLSTSNFQVNQDQSTGSYSINFVQRPNNNR